MNKLDRPNQNGVRPQSTAHSLVVHIWLVLVDSPQTRDGFRVYQLEDATLAVNPPNVARTVLRVLQQLEQELPEVRSVAASLRF